MDYMQYFYLGFIANIISIVLRIIISFYYTSSFTNEDFIKLKVILEIRRLFLINNVQLYKKVLNFITLFLPFYGIYSLFYYIYFSLRNESNLEGYINIIHSMDKVHIIDLFDVRGTDVYNN